MCSQIHKSLLLHSNAWAWTSVLYNELYLTSNTSSHDCCLDWEIMLSHGPDNRLCLDCTFLARAAWHVIHLNPITRLLVWSPSWKWQCGPRWREQEGRAKAQLWSSLLFLTVLDLILPHVAVISISCSSDWYNHCFGYKETKGVEGWVPTLTKWLFWGVLQVCFKVKGQMPRHIKLSHTLTI